MKELLGKTFTSIALHPDDEFVMLTQADGTKVYLLAHGACCSEPYFEDILNPENMIGSPILDVDDKYIGELKDPDEYVVNDVIDVWGYTIKTAKGHTDIEFRVRHNGYYGGEIEVEDALPDDIDEKDFKVLYKE